MTISKHDAYIGLNMVVPILCLLVSQAFADTLDADKSVDDLQVQSIYEYAGLESQLNWIATTVASETTVRKQNCSDLENIPNTNNAVLEALSIEVLRKQFLVEISQRTTPIQRTEILDWAKSRAGKSILNAEKASGDIDEQQYQQDFDSFTSSLENTEARSVRIASMLEETGAVFFVAAMNTGISNLVSIASVCSSSDDDIERAMKEIDSNSGSEALYRSMMRNDMILPTSVLYRRVADEDMDAYIAFADSDTGNAYFKALIGGLRSILSGRVAYLRRVSEERID